LLHRHIDVLFDKNQNDQHSVNHKYASIHYLAKLSK